MPFAISPYRRVLVQCFVKTHRSPVGNALKQVLLTVVLLFVANTVAIADDFEDGLAAFERQDYATAFAKFMNLAASDLSRSPTLDTFVSTLKAKDPAIPDDELTKYWNEHYGPAFEATVARAQFFLGVMYVNGRGVQQDYQQAFRWFSKAADAGHIGAHFNLGVLHEEEGGWGILVADLLYEAAARGDIGTQFNSGLMYDLQQGIPRAYTQAVRSFTKAAETGHTGAQFILGVMYAKGEGMPNDYVNAHKWLNLAAASTSEHGIRDLAVSYRAWTERKMSPIQIAEAQELAREWKPTTGTVPDYYPDTGGEKLAASGTGFIVSRQGHLLTNHHVIDGCQSVRATVAGHKQPITVVGTDAENDLAVLQLPAPSPSVARFREGRTIRPGDSVVVVGFPLPGLLASEANVTTGTVSALAGIGNNTRFLQITAPVQPGNSGGPLLDRSGQIVGVVVSKLNALTIAKATGDIPQNINFAINGAVAKAFLDSQSVEYETGASSTKMEPAESGAAAKKFTFLVECYR